LGSLFKNEQRAAATSKKQKMNRGAVVDQAEQIKWFDVLDRLTDWRPDVDAALQMARECQHPDAQWLAALFPAGTRVTAEHMREVMLQQRDDPRALYLASRLVLFDNGLLRRAAEKAHARAQVDLALRPVDAAMRVELLERACEQNDREGLFLLGLFYMRIVKRGVERAIELYRRAAELNHHQAQFEYGEMAFDERDWERYFWWAKATEGGIGEGPFCRCVAN
jgi:TPR repeat protein